MALIACAVFAVLVIIVATNSTDINRNDNITTTKPLELEKSYEDTIAKTRPLQLNNSLSKEKVDLEFQFLLDRAPSQQNLKGDIQSVNDFWNKRNQLADLEVEQLLGNRMFLDKKELKANQIILTKKYEEYDKSLSPTAIFPPSINFLQAKNLIEHSEIYEIIQKLPKGANLYGMLITSVDLDFMYQLTFEGNLYFRFEDDLKLKYSKTRPEAGWRLLSQLRESNNQEYIEDLNKAIKQSLTLTITNPQQTNEAFAWQELLKVLEVHVALANYKPNFVKIFRRVLEILYDDNVMYAELRYDFPELYDLDGKIYNPASVLKLCKIILDDFTRTHNDFAGVRFIYAPIHDVNLNHLSVFRETATNLWKSNPDLIAGIGFIRKEDGREPLSDWVEELLKLPKQLKLFLNAGFSNNWGTHADYNLLDALILNSARIGEGFALNKHPVILNQLREKDVAVEFSPIAAQVLNYVKDLRNHPHALLVATDFPIVIGNAGGTMWNNTGLSYEWYEFYVAMTPRFCDLRCLKELAVNSLVYSTLSTDEKRKNILAWKVKWDKFIDYVVSTYAP